MGWFSNDVILLGWREEDSNFKMKIWWQTRKGAEKKSYFDRYHLRTTPLSWVKPYKKDNSLLLSFHSVNLTIGVILSNALNNLSGRWLTDKRVKLKINSMPFVVVIDVISLSQSHPPRHILIPFTLFIFTTYNIHCVLYIYI